MELQHANVKVFAADATPVDLTGLIPVFHRWIQEKATEDLLLDVADYRHVPAGPGVVLVGHEADYALDETGGRQGLRYNRKKRLAGSNAERVRQALRAALQACERLDGDASLNGLAFSLGELHFWVNDRVLAGTPGAADAIGVELEAALHTVAPEAGYTVHLEQADPRELPVVVARSAQPPTVAQALGALN